MVGILLPGIKGRIIREQASLREARELFPGESLKDKTSPSEIFTTDGRLRTGDGFVADEQGRFL
jgi:hypothetical protein